MLTGHFGREFHLSSLGVQNYWFDKFETIKTEI